MLGFQLVVQHRAAGVITSTNFNLDALVMGQICVAEEARGHRVADRMYKYMRSCYSLHYPYLVTAIDARNARSRRVHERVGFKELVRFVSEETGKDWLIVIWEWRG